MATHVRKNITLPRSLDERLRKAARKRGTTQSGLIVYLVETGLAAEASQMDRLLSFVGVIKGPPDRRRDGVRPLIAIADTGLLIAALNHGDRHHRWAVNALEVQRKARGTIVVPDVGGGAVW